MLVLLPYKKKMMKSQNLFLPHAAAFHPSQTLIAVPIGTYTIEFDAHTRSKISSIDMGTAVVRMSYSPISGHTVIAILEVLRRVGNKFICLYEQDSMPSLKEVALDILPSA